MHRCGRLARWNDQRSECLSVRFKPDIGPRIPQNPIDDRLLRSIDMFERLRIGTDIVFHPVLAG